MTYNEDIMKDLTPEEKQQVLKILAEFSKEGKSETYDDLIYQDYEEIPVDVETFLKDPRYLGKGLIDEEGRFTVFPYWVETMKKIFPNNRDTAYNTLVLTGAIGIGKTFMADLCILYQLHRLLCLKDPYLYYGLQPIDKISISLLNAVSIDAARGVAWDKLQQLIQTSEWFMSHGTVKGRTNIEYVPNKKIELLAGSRNSHVIGRAIFSSLEDEINFSALTTNIENIKQKALKLITQVDARMQSRFMKGDKLPTLHIIVSSKDSEQSFLETYIDTKKKNESKTTLIVDEPQWVIRTDKNTKETFFVAVGNKFLASELIPKGTTREEAQEYIRKGYQLLEVPVGYYENFRDNIDIALTDIAGISTVNALKYISGVRWNEIKSKDYENPFTKDIIEVGNAKDDLAQYSDFFDLTKVNSRLKSRPLFIHLDMSISGDKTGIAGIWITGKKPTAEGESSSKELFFKLAFSVSIKAPKGYQISFEKNKNFIRWLKQQGFNIKHISSDTFQSAQIQQQLSADGFETSILSVDRVDAQSKSCLPYAYLKSTIYERRLEIYDKCDLLTQEIIGLERLSSGKIEHPDAGKSGCFTGDTKVRLVDGRSLSFIELIDEYNSNKDNYVYSINLQTKKIEPKKILKAWMTLRNQPLIKVTFDNGESVRCTLNHRFMLRNGTYIEAKDLIPGDSLMPLYTRISQKGLQGYRLYYEPFEDSWHYEHRKFAYKVLDEKYLVHHIDCNKLNNNPENLIWCSKKKHHELHSNNGTGAYLPEIIEKRNKSLSEYYKNNKNNPIFIERNRKISETLKSKTPLTERLAKEQEKERKHQLYLERKENGLKNKEEHSKHIKDIEDYFNVKYDDLTYSEKNSLGVKYSRIKNPKIQENISKVVSVNHTQGKYKNAENALAEYNKKCKILKKLYPIVDDEIFIRLFGFSYNSLSTGSAKGVWINRYRKKLYEIQNHSVVSIEFLDYREDVYDIEVEDNHNFALDCGVFVHNSKDQADALTGALYIASQNGEQYAYDYGEDIETTIEVSQGISSSETQKRQITIQFEEQMKDLLDPLKKSAEEAKNESSGVSNKQNDSKNEVKKDDAYKPLNFGFGASTPYKPPFLNDGIIFWG